MSTNGKNQAQLVGVGRVDDPVRGDGGRCPVRGCTEFGKTLRITNSGYAVLYCYAHEVEAAEHFDRV